jgi:5'-methylthioadenosine phosphorylase
MMGGSIEPVAAGILGGTGIQEMAGLEVLERIEIETPFGPPSAPYVIGRLEGRRVAFLARHGEGHRLLPSELNFRANIYGFKALGAPRILSASAVGSMREQIRPLDVVVVDQFIDRTRHRADTFFGEGIVAHVAFADPVCPTLRRALAQAARAEAPRSHDGGTYLCMEGPQFSTRAESNLYRTWGVDVIGMTNLQEAKLAREAEICYATLALVTDYDCWKMEEEPVTVEAVLDHLRRNAETAQRVLRAAVRGMPDHRDCACAQALSNAILTAREKIPPATRQRLALLLDRTLA